MNTNKVFSMIKRGWIFVKIRVAEIELHNLKEAYKISASYADKYQIAVLVEKKERKLYRLLSGYNATFSPVVRQVLEDAQ